MKIKQIVSLLGYATFFSGAVSAIEVSENFDFEGYFRAGANTQSTGGARNGGSCYALNHVSNDGLFYRLGNECRDYGEFTFVPKGSSNGLDFKGVFTSDWASDSRRSTATEAWSRRTRQLYVQVDGAFDNGASIWAGRRFYRDLGGIGDVHTVDAFHVNSSGNGFGISDIPLGGENKLHIALLGTGVDVQNDITVVNSDGVVVGTVDGAQITSSSNSNSSVHVVTADVRLELGLGAAGTLRAALQHLVVNEVDVDVDGLEDTTGGSTLTLQWEKKLGIFDQKTVVQYGTDAFARNPGCFGTDGIDCVASQVVNPDADGESGYRVFNNGTWDISNSVKVNTMAMYEDSDINGEATSFGIRPQIAISDHWSVIGEVGVNSIEQIGAEEETLRKFTLGLQLSADATNFWERPAVRFYVSNFEWNDEASTGASGLSLSDPDETGTTVVGVQTEFWF